MEKMTVEEIIKATGGELLSKSKTTIIESVSIDSRKIENNALFVPLIGENQDGHRYIKNAFSNGCVASLTSEESDKTQDQTIIKVNNTQTALGDIARYYKNKFNIKTIAVTGSVGKTTTKDMLSSVMSMQYRTLKTQGNFNNELGLPLTVLKLNKNHEAAVFEMGMSAFGEIRYLSDIIRPDMAVITNIGMSHIENLGSQEGIFKAKTEMCEFFNKDNVLVVNGDDKFLKKAKEFKGFRVITYGIENECDYMAWDIENLGIEGTKFTTLLYEKEYRIHIKTPGIHNVYNALAAIVCATHYDIGPKKIVEGLENFILTDMRMSVERVGNITIINDCYNSSPDSVRAALKVLKTQQTRKVAVLGDILEMGEFSKNAHFELGKEVVDSNVDLLLTVGKNAKYIAQGAIQNGMTEEKIVSFGTTDELVKEVGDFIKENDSILIKASRGMHFEKIVEKLREENKEG